MSEIKRTKKSEKQAAVSAPVEKPAKKAVAKIAAKPAPKGKATERPFSARSGTLRVTLRPGEGAQPKKRQVMSAHELAGLGGGRVAYIKVMTPAEAMAMFPAVEDLPQGINLYALHAADGTPLALTDTLSAALGQAMGDELVVAAVH